MASAAVELPELPGEGRFHFEGADAAADVRSQVHSSGLWWLVAAIAIPSIGFVLLGGDPTRSGVLLIVSLALGSILARAPRRAAARVEKVPREHRSLRVKLTSEHLVVVDGSGVEQTTSWQEFLGFRRVGERIFLYRRGTDAYVLPQRAWSTSEEFARVSAFVASRLPEIPLGKALRYAAIFWLVLIALFVAVWSFFSDVPRQQGPTDPRSKVQYETPSPER